MLDVDGVCIQGAQPIPGSVQALERLRHVAKGHRLITNQSQEPCAAVMGKLRGLGFDVRASAARAHGALGANASPEATARSSVP